MNLMKIYHGESSHYIALIAEIKCFADIMRFKNLNLQFIIIF